nr:hypothetical protein I308_04631 [Cryptococcus tetragattii IND107]
MSVVHKCDQSQSMERLVVHHATGNLLKFSIRKSTPILTMDCPLHHPLDLVNKYRLALIRICLIFHIHSLKDHRHQAVKETPIMLGIFYPTSSVCSGQELGQEMKRHPGDHLRLFPGNPRLRKEMVKPGIQIVLECGPILLISAMLVEV